ncbi:hypothetical protein phiAS5_ORF0050 [Aeromonas phage phiAS5]|uniref:Uncharacterized protein n=1 Tax=Aeromonas phage phiAS5 TaxID=879630 RepID=E1A2E7_9CAUD|nr:hypothetical protein phiAS5_ORF0050 [Aeromonas phage phiAS5]ADM79893.1 hypothetical protein phiAS5_ORF0050 [Aeromonas phage phiAS5]BES53338.1 hypothetical protein [Aeromonas phage phiWae14]
MILQSEKKIFVTDVDGVLLSWASNLPFFCAEYNIPTDVVIDLIIDERFRKAGEIFQCNQEHGENLIRMYNNSKWFRGLKAYDDALLWVNKLKSKYDFVATTAIGSDFQVSVNRMSNLNVLFPGAFKEILTCDHHESKRKMFLHVKEKYGEQNVVGYADDLYHHLQTFHTVFSADVPKFHVLRGQNKSYKSSMTSRYDVSGFGEIANILSARESINEDLDGI